MNGIRVLCISDSQRPKEIPESKWVKRGEKYTVDKLMRMNHPKSGQVGVLGITLKEIKLDETNYPYKYFLLHRFKPLDTDEELLDILEREMTAEDIKILEPHEL